MLHILGMGYAFPEESISNDFIEKLDVGTTAEWISSKIGIENRRTTLPLDYIQQTQNKDPREARAVASMSATDLGVQAAKQALQVAGVDPSKVGKIICNCCTPSATLPAESFRIMKGLGLNCEAYDVFTACPIFALHLNFLESFEEESLPEYVLCVSTATLTQKVDYTDRSDGAIWGDGAAAWVVSLKEQRGLRVLDTSFMADPKRAGAVIVESLGHFWQDGRAVRDFSVRQTVRLIKALEKSYDIDWTKDIFIGHQANRTMLEQITKNRKIPDTNHWHNVTDIGNQAGAGAPATLAMHWNDITPGQKIVVAVVGAGLSWGAALLEGV